MNNNPKYAKVDISKLTKKDTDNIPKYLQELFNIAWKLNQSDETICELSQKVTTYLPLVMQEYDYLKNR